MSERRGKKDWALDAGAFERLLAWLDDGTPSEGARYVEMRRRLVDFFDRKGCPDADDLADETLSRCARRLEEEGRIEGETPARFCYITARFVFMESLRDKSRGGVALEDAPPRALESRGDLPDDERLFRELRLECLERCIGELPEANRAMIVEYYVGEERAKIDNRRRIAADLGISVNALAIRACRIRDRLEQCVAKCVGSGTAGAGRAT